MYHLSIFYTQNLSYKRATFLREHCNNHYLHLNFRNRAGTSWQLVGKIRLNRPLGLLNQRWMSSVCRSLRMKIAVLGATGQTGQYLVNQALQQGHTVTAIVRNPGKLAVHHDNLKVMRHWVGRIVLLLSAYWVRSPVKCEVTWQMFYCDQRGCLHARPNSRRKIL